MFSVLSSVIQIVNCDFVFSDAKNFMNKKYNSVMEESDAVWFSDGVMADPEIADLPIQYQNLSSEMTFILVFSL